jgi:type II secretory pathway pseudopilin PulG
MTGRDAPVRAFSLVEVTIALGLLAFCLVALIGLLPMALGSVRSARAEAAAVNALRQIASSIRSAVPGNQPLAYRATGPYDSLSWSLGGGTITTNLQYVSESGFPATGSTEGKFAARIELTPPADLGTPGTARISVAWPSQAEWDETSARWKNADGSVSTWTVFLAVPSS